MMVGNRGFTDDEEEIAWLVAVKIRNYNEDVLLSLVGGIMYMFSGRFVGRVSCCLMKKMSMTKLKVATNG